MTGFKNIIRTSMSSTCMTYKYLYDLKVHGNKYMYLCC